MNTQIHSFFAKPKNTLLVALCILVIYALVSDSANFEKIFSFFSQTLTTLPAAPAPALIEAMPPVTPITSN